MAKNNTRNGKGTKRQGLEQYEQADGNDIGTPTIEPEPLDAILVGNKGQLTIPHEDFDKGLDDGEELDLTGAMPPKLRKPGRREWIALAPDKEMATCFLIHKPNASSIEEEYYWVDKKVRQPIKDELKQVRIVPYYSFETGTHDLWVVKVTSGNSWYESIHALLKKDVAFFAANAIRVFSDKEENRYRVKMRPITTDKPVKAWPSKPTSELLGEALGNARCITTLDHPLIREFTEGTELT